MTRPKRLLQNRILIPIAAVAFTLTLIVALRWLERLSVGYAIVTGVAVIFVASAAGAFILKATSGVICPKCGSREAKLIYKGPHRQKPEYVDCPVCKELHPTGNVQPYD